MLISIRMRIPLTKYGWPQVVVFPAAILIVMAGIAVAGTLGQPPILGGWAFISTEVLLTAVLIWVLSFFRDPQRTCPTDSNLLLAPADGRITDIVTLEEPPDFLRARGDQKNAVLRIGIFLSIFNAHINRSPCNVKVEKITYKRGKYKNALNPESSRLNESNELCLIRTDDPQDGLIVKQISGAVARRIVCDTTEGQTLAAGQKFGMLKFGSRTEIYVKLTGNAKCIAKIGDRVKAGLTPVVKYAGRIDGQ
jgi:phosphatidylserine decarboxylase